MHEPGWWAARLVSVPGQLREHLALLAALTLTLQTKAPSPAGNRCIKSNLQCLLVQLGRHIIGGTAKRKRVVGQGRAQEAMTKVISFLKGLRVFSVAPKGTPGTKGRKPRGNRKHIFVSYQEQFKSGRAKERVNGILLCTVVDSPTLEKHHGKEYPEGIQAQRGC